jgi:hypothetical protein
VTDCGIEATGFDAKSWPGRIRCARIVAMPAAPRPRLLAALLGLALVLAALASGCAVVTVAGAVGSAAVSVGSAAVSVGTTVVGTTVKVAGKAAEKTIDVVTPAK